MEKRKHNKATRGGSEEEMSRACNHRLVLLFTVFHSFVWDELMAVGIQDDSVVFSFLSLSLVKH